MRAGKNMRGMENRPSHIVKKGLQATICSKCKVLGCYPAHSLILKRKVVDFHDYIW